MNKILINPENIPSKSEIDHFLSDLGDMNAHKSIISQALNISENIAEVEAVFLFGSLAKGTADIFSDIDFYLLIKEQEDYERIIEFFLEDLDMLGEVIHIFQSNAKQNSIIIYIKPFIKFELVVESFSSLSKEWRLAKRAKLLFDKNGLGKKALKLSRQLEFNLEPHLNEIRNMALDLPSFCFLISGYMMRGEYITIIDFIAWIRRKLLRISGFMLEIWDEGTRRAEQRFPKELISYYNRCKLKNVNDVWNCLMVLMEWYSDWLVPQFEKHAITHANQEIPTIRFAILKLKDSFQEKSLGQGS
jgi:predicted nucleotidyltransferase